MKIIMAGKPRPEPPPKWWIGFQWDCEKCNAKFELEAGDAVAETFRNCQKHLILQCPCCKCLIKFSRKA